MEIAGLLIQPAVLLAAFIFFWREAKAGRQELKVELKVEMQNMETRMQNMETRIREDIGKMEHRIARIEDIMLSKKQTS
ncbi:MAG: hypothetical protein F4Y38_02050 [Gemmatimonadetes bacterium]|nr:hypothetical protein [Gemmatimonadota bacterium]MYG86390.1 hypothetical protein [Gemmatimonadota bacterium]MYJ90027.1 hypothetical protein [Gemmatimonadota bacterium]